MIDSIFVLDILAQSNFVFYMKKCPTSFLENFSNSTSLCEKYHVKSPSNSVGTFFFDKINWKRRFWNKRNYAGFFFNFTVEMRSETKTKTYVSGKGGWTNSRHTAKQRPAANACNSSLIWLIPHLCQKRLFFTPPGCKACPCKTPGQGRPLTSERIESKDNTTGILIKYFTAASLSSP